MMRNVTRIIENVASIHAHTSLRFNDTKFGSMASLESDLTTLLMFRLDDSSIAALVKFRNFTGKDIGLVKGVAPVQIILKPNTEFPQIPQYNLSPETIAGITPVHLLNQ